MKPARFDYAVPATLEEAFSLLRADPLAKIMAGGQTLGPMLNLRLVQPTLIVDITRIPDLVRIEEDDGGVSYGACVTHAAIEDGRLPDCTGGALQRVARGIAYRAVRTRGTIGGSLAHADPAADWLSALSALGAEVVAYDGRERRTIPVSQLTTGVFETALETGEILEAVRLPKLSDSARFGYCKICRKTGEFAEAIGAVLLDREAQVLRVVAGASDGAPIVIEDTPPSAGLERDWIRAQLIAGGIEDPVELQLHLVAVERAANEAMT